MVRPVGRRWVGRFVPPATDLSPVVHDGSQNGVMGLLTEYFTAPDDARAAAVVSTAGPSRTGLAAVDAYGIEPFVQMGTLEEIITGRPYEQIAAGQPDPVASLGGGKVLVTRLRDELVRALADLDEQRVTAVATTWAGTEEFWGATDPEALADLLRALGGLARSGDGDGVYCWLSV